MGMARSNSDPWRMDSHPPRISDFVLDIGPKRAHGRIRWCAHGATSPKRES
jgi:hypothetical protein